MKIKLSILLLSLLAAVSCKRPQSDGASVSIQIPSVKQFAASAKNSSLSGVPVDYSRLCFAVNITGAGIDSIPASACDIERGTQAGPVQPGETLTVDVQGGSNRTFEIYGFLRNAAADPCPSINEAKWSGQSLQKIYLLGSKSGVEIVPPTSKVAVDILMPLDSDNIAVTKAWPAACGGVAVVSHDIAGNVVAGAGELTGSTMKMRAHVSERNFDQILNGSTMKFTGGAR